MPRVWPHILQPLLLPLCFARGFTCRTDVFFVPAACKLITDRHPARTNTLRLYILAATHNHNHRVIIIAINAIITIIIHSALHSRLQPLAIEGNGTGGGASSALCLFYRSRHLCPNSFKGRGATMASRRSLHCGGSQRTCPWRHAIMRQARAAFARKRNAAVKQGLLALAAHTLVLLSKSRVVA